MAAKTLCEAGLRVLALNPGRRLEPARDYRNHKARYEMPFRGFGDPGTKDVRYHDESEYTEGLWNTTSRTPRRRARSTSGCASR